MIPDRATFKDDEVDLRDYLVVVWRKRWLVGAVFAIVLALTWWTNPTSSVPIYETRGRVMLVAPISELIIGQPFDGGRSLLTVGTSVDILATLGTGYDLMQAIIDRLDLVDQATGVRWSAERLAGMVDVDVQASNGTGGLPIFTTFVRGKDPNQIKTISDAWTESFMEQSSQLFAKGTSRSYDFVLALYTEANLALEQIEEDQLLHQLEYPLPVLMDERKLRQSNLEGYLKISLNASDQLTLKTQQYEAVLVRIDELSSNGRWIGLYLNGERNGIQPSGTTEQQAILRLTDQLFQVYEDIRKFKLESGLTVTKQRLEIKGELSKDYIRELEAAENSLRVETATLEVLDLELDGQPEMLVFVKAVEDTVLWQRLGVDPTVEEWDRLRELGIRSEEVNPVFVELNLRLIESRANVAALRETVELLTERLQETRDELGGLEEVVAEMEDVQLASLLERSGQLQKAYDRERENYTGLLVAAVNLRNEARSFQGLKDDYKVLVDVGTQELTEILSSIAEAELVNQRLDRRSQVVQRTLKVISEKLEDAQIARAGQTQNVAILESAVVPNVPLSMADRSGIRMLIGGSLGLILGVGAALVVNFVQFPDELKATASPRRDRNS